MFTNLNIFIMRRFYSFLCLPLLIMAASSCQFDDTELQNSIDDLTSRVEALEDFQEQVQGDIASLQDIISKLNSSVTVNNVVDNGDGSWTINFSDGTSITIRNGQDGEDGLTPPSITVVEEDGTYYWAYEDADGNTEFIFDDDGNKIPVSSEAPQVQINPETGNWEISTDGGKTWEDTGVKAEGGSGDSFFKNVYVEDGILYLVLADGTVIKVPMTAELAFDFGTGGSVLYFAAGESKTLDYTMSGAETYTITKPDGWRASIEGNGLVITAPVAENTFAETEGVVSVILFAENGQSFMAEQAVAIGDTPDVPDLPDPVIGDYYYSDGTWSSEPDASKTLIGLVYWVGDATSDDPELKADHPGCTHGLVMALGETPTPWQYNYDVYGKFVNDWVVENTDYSPVYTRPSGEYSEYFNSRVGYNCSKALSEFNAAPENAEWPVEAMQVVEQYRKDVPAPAVSSGWYFPSPKELSLMCSGEVDGSIWDIAEDTDVKEFLNGILGTLDGASLLSASYWSCFEYKERNPYYVQFIDGAVYNDMGKSMSSDNLKVRCILAF